ncbi:MAG: hypothetical protein JNK02_17320 [Planctomycetes bacterium]|nr:hypothetical protein [Planctomycetota bacterium]
MNPWLSMAFLAGLVSWVPAQEGGAPRGAQRPPVNIPLPGGQDDVQRQMLELFEQVERELRAIDALLQQAARTEPKGGGALSQKLRAAQASSQSVKQGIDRILELAQSQSQNSSSSSSSSQGQGQGQGQSPLDQRGEQSTGREQTPSTPEQGAGQEQPGGERPRGEEPRPDGQRPGQDPGRERRDGPQASSADPEQRPGSDPARGAQGGPAGARDGRDRWGDLPVHAREVFRNEGGRDMPPLYRDWIDAYYRRLNRAP